MHPGIARIRVPVLGDSMKLIAWGGVVAFALMPVNFLLIMIAKLVHHEPLVPEDGILLAAALFGLLMSFTLHRQWLYKRRTKRGSTEK